MNNLGQRNKTEKYVVPFLKGKMLKHPLKCGEGNCKRCHCEECEDSRMYTEKRIRAGYIEDDYNTESVFVICFEWKMPELGMIMMTTVATE